VIALILVLIYNYSKPTLLVLAVAYSISGPILRLYGIVRRRKASEELTLADSVQHH
jgi:hypothetical protein